MNGFTLKIDGMACGMCEVHVCGTIRQALPCARKVKASHRKGEASFLCDGPVDEEALKAALDATGYRLLEMALG